MKMLFPADQFVILIPADSKHHVGLILASHKEKKKDIVIATEQGHDGHNTSAWCGSKPPGVDIKVFKIPTPIWQMVPQSERIPVAVQIYNYRK